MPLMFKDFSESESEEEEDNESSLFDSEDDEIYLACGNDLEELSDILNDLTPSTKKEENANEIINISCPPLQNLEKYPKFDFLMREIR
jgi:hypothetical protein